MDTIAIQREKYVHPMHSQARVRNQFFFLPFLSFRIRMQAGYLCVGYFYYWSVVAATAAAAALFFGFTQKSYILYKSIHSTETNEKTLQNNLHTIARALFLLLLFVLSSVAWCLACRGTTRNTFCCWLPSLQHKWDEATATNTRTGIRIRIIKIYISKKSKKITRTKQINATKKTKWKERKNEEK